MCSELLHGVSEKLALDRETNVSVSISSQDAITVYRKAHMHSASSHGSLSKVALDNSTIVILVEHS